MARVAEIRASMPGYLCPDGFDPLAAYLRETSAPPEVWAALRRAQTGAVQLRGAANDALAYAGGLERKLSEK